MPSSIPQLKTCCGCCKTETGAKIIGWLQTISCSLASLYAIYALTISIQNLHKPAQVSYKDIDGNYTNFTVKEPSEVREFVVDVVLSAVAVVCFGISVVTGIFLLIGISKRNKSYIKIWIIVSIVYLIFPLTAIVLNVIFTIAGKSISIHLLQSIITFACSIYYLLVVYSYYREIKPGATRMS